MVRQETMQSGPPSASFSEPGPEVWEDFQEYASVGTSVGYVHDNCVNPERYAKIASSPWMTEPALFQHAHWKALWQ